MSIVTLVSGGVDSTVMALMAKKEGAKQFPLFVDYGQLSADKEWRTCNEVFGKNALPSPVKMDLRGYGAVVPSGITNRDKRVYEDAFLPGRNILLLLAGAGYAYEVKANAVAIGLLSEHTSLFPDQNREFLDRFEVLFRTATESEISVIAPLMRFSKRDVLKLAKTYKVKGTYSCHAGTDEPCGKCVSCKEINEAGL